MPRRDSSPRLTIHDEALASFLRPLSPLAIRRLSYRAPLRGWEADELHSAARCGLQPQLQRTIGLGGSLRAPDAPAWRPVLAAATSAERFRDRRGDGPGRLPAHAEFRD